MSAARIAAARESVLAAYDSASKDNRLRLLQGDDKATPEYIFPNQREDAANIFDKFYKHNRRVISVIKKTKVGADGLMIEILKLFTTHSDDSFVIDPANVRIITGMSNISWEKDMIEKSPGCFKNKIFHHGKLSKADLTTISNGLIIIDEIDCGDKERQILHNKLKEANLLDVDYMKKNNNRFVLISATMIKELYELYRWGDLHEFYKMTIPKEYIGHNDFLVRGIIQEFYPLNTIENASKWVQEDILDNYKNTYRVHIVRVNKKTVDLVEHACIVKGVSFRNHTSTDRLSPEEEKEFFKEPLTQHIVLGVKGFFRRANLIPNAWKIRIGATHEMWTLKLDNNVQVQGLPGRMTGYWREIIDAGHKTGPHRTSIRAIEEYERVYNDPFGPNSYQTAGFKKKNGKVTATPIMLSARNIKNLDPLPPVQSTTIQINNYPEQHAENGRFFLILPDTLKKTAKQYYERIVRAFDNNEEDQNAFGTGVWKGKGQVLDKITRTTTQYDKIRSTSHTWHDVRKGDGHYRLVNSEEHPGLLFYQKDGPGKDWSVRFNL